VKSSHRNLYLIGAMMWLATIAPPAFASELLDQTTGLYQVAASNFGAQMVTFGTRLLWVLLSIQIGIDGMRMAMKDMEFRDLLEKLVMTVVVAAVYTALIKMCSSLLPSILNLFISAGQAGSGLPQLTPSGIIDQGIDVVDTLITSYNANEGVLDKVNPFVSLELTLLSLFIFSGYVALALQMVMTTISGYFWMAVTPLMLGFGGLSYTRDMATTTMKGGIAVGMKILVAYLLAAVGGKLAPLMGVIVAQASPLHPQGMWAAAAVSVIFVGLAWKLPALAADLTNGSASLSAGDAIKGAAMMAAGAAGVVAAGAGVAAVGAKAAGGMAAEATGVAKALNAGMESAIDHGKSGFGAVGHAMGQVGSQGLGMAKGAIGDKIAGGKASFASAVDSSNGGKIASSIQADRGGSMAGTAAPTSTSGGGEASGSLASDKNQSTSTVSPTSETNGAGSVVSASGESGTVPTTNMSSGTASAPSASSGAGEVGSGAAPSNNRNAVPIPASGGGAGNTSNASISGGGAGIPVPLKQNAFKVTQERMNSLAGYVPDDAHTVSVAANISHRND
jgi:type IV secretion system protein TrbL